MKLLRDSLLILCAAWLSACATTGALVAQHPEASEAVQIATAVEQCADPAIAAAINGDWSLGLAAGVQCIAQLVANLVLPAALEKDARVSLAATLVAKQGRELKSYKARDAKKPLEPNPYKGSATEVEKSNPLSLSAPPLNCPAVSAVIRVPELYSWEQIIATNSAD